MWMSDVDPRDLPAPQTIDEVARAFELPLMAFSPQPSLTEMGAGSMSSSVNGGPTVVDSASLSYMLWRNPADHADPINLAELDDSTRRSLEQAPHSLLPDWLVARQESMRFPSLYDAVTTTRVPDTNAESPRSTLVWHVNDVLMNQFHEERNVERVVGGFRGAIDPPVTERHIEDFPVSIDGVDVPGMRINTDPHVYAVGVDLGSRILTAVISREHLTYISMTFVTRPAPPAPG